MRQENSRGVAQPSDFFVDQHGFGAVAFLQRQERYQANLFIGASPENAGGFNRLVLMFQRADDNRNLPEVTLRCSVNGERLDMGRRPVGIENGQERLTSATELNRQPNNRVDRDPMNWTWNVLTLPITFDRSSEDHEPDMVALDEHPGHWSCDLRNDQRQTVRTIEFDVENARVVPHPEEASLSFPPNVNLATMTIPEDSPVDDRTDRAAAARPFYGHRWESDEGQAMARRVPRIGTPFPRSAGR